MGILCLDFLLSHWHDFRGRWAEDRLLQPEWLEAFGQRWHLQIADAASEEIVRKLQALRALIRRIAEALSGGTVADADLRELNQIMEKVPRICSLLWDGERFQTGTVPVQKNWDWFMAEIALSFADLLAGGDTRRIKVCDNEYCRSIFYDKSKSRTRRYCSNTKCGNLWKLRRFRARRKAIEGFSTVLKNV